MPRAAVAKPPEISESARLTLAEAAEYVGRRRAGRATHPDTVRAWALHGLRGVRLRSEFHGGVRMTTTGWIREFFEQLTTMRNVHRDDDGAAAREPTPRQRLRDHQRAEDELRRKGILR